MQYWRRRRIRLLESASLAHRSWPARDPAPALPIPPDLPAAPPRPRPPSDPRDPALVSALVERAKEHPLGLDFLKGGHLGSVAAAFETHAFTVLAARETLR